MPDLEAIGDAATGAVIAGAVEPRTGAADDGHTHEKNCLNCGAELTGNYCSACGQKAHVHRTLTAFWHDLLHGVFHFEGKIWNTLPLLVWKPGELTRRYIDGERARFVSPIALFLFAVFLTFAVINLIGALDFSGRTTSQGSRQELELAVKEIETELAEARAEGKSTEPFEARLAEARQGLDRDLANRQVVDVNLGEGTPGWINSLVAKARANPELLIYKLQTNAYKYSWLLIPISVPFLWLLFLNRRAYRRFGAYDHTVFITYSLSFMTLLFVVLTMLGKLVASNDLAVLALMIVPPLHMHRQLKGAYGLSRFSAAWRAAALTLFALMALIVFLLALLALGVFG